MYALRAIQSVSKIIKPPTTNKLPKQNHQINYRHIWGYVAIAFNRVDEDRLQRVGPDRLCAEWILKNGGAVVVLDMPEKLLRDYNVLPPESTKIRIAIVDASDASIMKIGLDHFKGCKHINKIIFHNCKYLEEDGLEGLLYLKSSLKELQISGCYNIRDAGLNVIGELKNLQSLKIFDMDYVRNMDQVIQNLQQQLPHCKIDTTK